MSTFSELRKSRNRAEIRRGIGLALSAVLSGAVVAPSAGARQTLSDFPQFETTCDSANGCLRLLRMADDDPKVAMGAVVALGQLRAREAVPDLITIVEGHDYGTDVYAYTDTPHSQLVITAIRALGTIQDRRAIPALVEFVKKEPYIQYRVLAAEMIKMIGIDTGDIPILLDLLNDPHTSVRYVIFEAIRFADDPVSKDYTKRFINYIPRADMIEDSLTRPVGAYLLGVPDYPNSRYLFYASASEDWIMRDRPEHLKKTRWVHTYLTPDPVDRVVRFYEESLGLRAMTRAQIEARYSFAGEKDPESSFIADGSGFILNKASDPALRAPVEVVSIYHDTVLKGTAITIYAPRTNGEAGP